MAVDDIREPSVGEAKVKPRPSQEGETLGRGGRLSVDLGASEEGLVLEEKREVGMCAWGSANATCIGRRDAYREVFAVHSEFGSTVD
jgi:hypothetical protein